MTIWDSSRIIHDMLFRDVSQSLCSRAWEHRAHPGWAVFVRVFGARHCERSWRYYHDQRETWDVM